MFLAGVHWAYFAVVLSAGAGTVWAVFESRGTPWQLLKDYQFRRIDTFLDPSTDPLGAGYHITQAKIAMGSGGPLGRGFGLGLPRLPCMHGQRREGGRRQRKHESGNAFHHRVGNGASKPDPRLKLAGPCAAPVTFCRRTCPPSR